MGMTRTATTVRTNLDKTAYGAIKLVYHFTITIAGAGGLTGTATLTPAVVKAKTLLIHLGTRGSNAAAEMFNTLELSADGTTVTATRAGSTSDGVTVSGCAVEFY